jgi:hypothetical protein
MISTTGFSKEKEARIRATMQNAKSIRGSAHLDVFDVPGYLYVAIEEETGHTKIGASTDPIKRMKGLKSEHGGREHRLLFMYHISHMYNLEAQFHAWFCDERIGTTEHFKLTQAQIAEAFALIPEWN